MDRRLTLSVVIPSLNHGKYIGDAIRSLLDQQDVEQGELEIIVVDGGSSDETVQVLGSFEGRLAFWSSEPDGGQTDALIKGFRRASGDILGWLCADDLLEPYAVREVLDWFFTHPAQSFVYGDAAWLTSEGRFLRVKKEIPFQWYIWLHDHNYIPQPAAFFRKSLYEHVGGLDPSLELAMDTDLFARFALRTRPQHLPRQWARIRTYPEQKNRRLRTRSDLEDRIIRERLGVSFGNRAIVLTRFLLAKVLRVSWKLASGAYR